MTRPLTPSDRVAAFRVATSGLARRIELYGLTVMTDAELTDALHKALGTCGGQCGPGQMHISWQASGLKIWASWHIHNVHREQPIFAGSRTVAMAREVYGLRHPADRQMSLNLDTLNRLLDLSVEENMAFAHQVVSIEDQRRAFFLLGN